LEGVAIIDSVAVLAMQEVFQIMFDDWVLSNSSIHCSGCIDINTITESKDVFESLVL